MKYRMIIKKLLLSGRNITSFFSGKTPRLFCFLLFCFLSFRSIAQPYYGISVNTTVTGTVNPEIKQFIGSQNLNVIFRRLSANYPNAFVVGKIERLSPSPFVITLNRQFRYFDDNLQVHLNTDAPVALTAEQKLGAFANFDEQFLNIDGINIEELKDANNNFRLPEGTYRICFQASSLGQNREILSPLSDPNLGCATFVVLPPEPENAVVVNTRAGQQIDVIIKNGIVSGNFNSTLLYNANPGQQVAVKLQGKLESLSPNPFTIAVAPSYSQQQGITLHSGMPVNLTPNQILDAFANFNEQNLISSGIDLNEIKDRNNNIRLPDGLYKLCLAARYFIRTGELTGNASNPNTGCATFNICRNTHAPQFTQPASSLSLSNDINILHPQQPVVFSWLPPQSSCLRSAPRYTYNFEIRELLDFQTFTDAINNPPVFQKTQLPSSTFILDTLLYNNVLKRGHRYVIRVKAIAPLNSGISIENNGYSRVEAFQFGIDSSDVQTEKSNPAPQQPQKGSIPTTIIKGKASWVFKKGEELFKMPPAREFNGDISKMNIRPGTGSKNLQLVKHSIDPNFLITHIESINTLQKEIVKKNLEIKPESSTQLLSTVSGDGDLVELKDLMVQSIPGQEKHPLAGATVLLKAVKVAKGSAGSIRTFSDNHNVNVNGLALSERLGIVQVKNSGVANAVKLSQNYLMAESEAQEEDLVASGKTDAQGNFIFDFIDPKFRNITKYTRLHLIIQDKDFEPAGVYFDIKEPDEKGNIDLGEITLMAKTFRFTPLLKNTQSMVSSPDVEIFCPKQLYDQNPHLAFMADGKSGEPVNIGGRMYIRIAKIKQGQTLNRLFYTEALSTQYLLKISSDKISDYYAYLGLAPLKYCKTGINLNNNKREGCVDESDLVIGIRELYKLKGRFPVVAGKVQMNRGDGIIPVANAVVKISYPISKVKDQSKEFVDSYQDFKNLQLAGFNMRFSKTFKTISQKSEGKTMVGAANMLNSLVSVTTITDSSGNYRIDNLPILSDGTFTITCESPIVSKVEQKQVAPLYYNDSSVQNFQLNPQVVAITGMVVDKEGNVLNNATVRWKSGGNPVDADNGLFVIKNIPGKDSLIISRFGYITNTIGVDVKKETQKAGAEESGLIVSTSAQLNSNIEHFVAGLKNQPSVKLVTKSAVTPAVFGFAQNTKVSSTPQMFSSMYNSLFREGDKNTGFNDLGKVGFLEKRITRVNFKVSDVGNNPIKDAEVFINNSITVKTDNSGSALYNGATPGMQYVVSGPAGGLFVNESGEFGELPSDGTISTVTIILQKGIQLKGNVTDNGKSVEDAKIYIEGKDFISTHSDKNGEFVLLLPKGENNVLATKSGYYPDHFSQVFSTDIQHNFQLKSDGNKNITKLLGFDIELEKSVADGRGEKWTGHFINLNGNDAIKLSSGSGLKFSNIKVMFDASGNAIPEGNIVPTDETEIRSKIFDFLPVILKGSPQITVSRGDDGKGYVSAKIILDYGQWPASGGLILKNLETQVLPKGFNIDQQIPIFVSDGSKVFDPQFSIALSRQALKLAAEQALNLFQDKVDNASGAAKDSLEVKLKTFRKNVEDAGRLVTGAAAVPADMSQYISASLFGFESLIDLKDSHVKSDRIELGGMVLSPGIPIISTLAFDIDELKIGTDLSVKEVSIKTNVHAKFTIASWTAEVNSVSFNMSGFKVSGEIDVKVPSSPDAVFGFKDLRLSKEGIYGGSFIMPPAGVNIFNIISLENGKSPITFGKVGNSSVYKVGGSARFAFKKLFKESIEIPYFQIQTDGNFAVQVPVNKSLNAGFARFKLNSMTFNTNGSPHIDLNGTFVADVKLLRFTTGNIKFLPSGNVQVDRIGVGLDIPGTRVDAYVDIKDNGFAGGGTIGITGTPVKADIAFHYYKNPTGAVDLGASFAADVKIPLGFVIISKVGGGFTYRSNPDYFSVTITGGASITGFESLVALDPISLTVESGPKITGEVHVKVASSFDVAKASIVIDIPNAYVAVEIIEDIEPVPDIVRSHIQGDLIISGKKGDSYLFLGAGMDVNLLGLIHSRGVYAIGIGVNDAKTRPSISYYMKDVPDEYLNNGSFTGAYVRATSEIGVKEKDAVGFDIDVASFHLWLYSSSDFYIIANFTNLNFAISSDMYFEGGIKAELVGIGASASAKACTHISGGYNDTKGWNFAASASGEAILNVGSDDCSCNSVNLAWPCGKICVGGGAKIRYESRTGGLKEFSLFLGEQAKCD